jgi:hypothetical protein
MARDGFASVVALEVWMRSYGLLETSTRLGRDDHEQAMDPAAHCGIFPRLAPSDRRAGVDAARLNAAAAKIIGAIHTIALTPFRVTLYSVEAQRGAPVVQDQDHVPLEVELVELDIDGCMPQ